MPTHFRRERDRHAFKDNYGIQMDPQQNPRERPK